MIFVLSIFRVEICVGKGVLRSMGVEGNLLHIMVLLKLISLLVLLDARFRRSLELTNGLFLLTLESVTS